MGSCTGMFSQAFSTVTRHTPLPLFVPACFTLHKAPFSTLDTISVQTWQASDVTLSNQRTTWPFSTTLHSGKVAPQKTRLSWWTANILSQQCNPRLLEHLQKAQIFQFRKNIWQKYWYFKCTKGRSTADTWGRSVTITRERIWNRTHFSETVFNLPYGACCTCFKRTNPTSLSHAHRLLYSFKNQNI